MSKASNAYGVKRHHKLMCLEENKAGRDFVVGDIHGQYDDLMHQLYRVGFNEEADRLIAVGDLRNLADVVQALKVHLESGQMETKFSASSDGSRRADNPRSFLNEDPFDQAPDARITN